MARIIYTTEKQEEVLGKLGLNYPHRVVLVPPAVQERLLEKGFTDEQICSFGEDYKTYSSPDIQIDRVPDVEGSLFEHHLVQHAEEIDITNI
jgi:hypothetical protein